MDWTDTVLTIPAYGIFAEATGLWKTPEFMTQVLPKIRYTEIPGTGHFVMMERPQAFDRLLIQFVESL
jgi:pimeloyl-ACP methyl ester carboxylesterase